MVSSQISSCSNLSKSEILERALAQFENYNRRLSTARQARFGEHGKISVELIGPKAGAWYDFSSGGGGWVDGSGVGRPERHEGPRTPYSFDPRRAEIVQAYLAETRAAEGGPVDLYLRNRGIRCPIPHSIRFLPSPPGMLCIMHNASGTPMAIQITYLTRDGRKADRSVQKQTFATGDGWHRFAAVRIPGRGELIICEGVETGLSLYQATGRPVWCCCSVSNIAAIRVTQRRFTIARDGDEPGSTADRTYHNAFERFLREGKSIKVATPPTGKDFNDILLERGEGEIIALLRGATQCQR